ncbi:hypothetical protein [uncultured Aquimarina sp.]|uniref:DUF6896 domain-containing protein n=1 Tax=uncultured Aquimarina sp. TaxID=575652 RepID=UPI00262158CB|nr:hypothetical protein [uncultured Aquimarina sp.]
MKKEIDTYIGFIKDFEEELNTTFNISGNIWEKAGNDFPKLGEFNGYKYSFHGAGCRVEKEGVICEYDIAPLNNTSIKFSLWKLFNFIKTNPSLQDMSKDDVHVNILKLIEDKIISKLIIENIDTGIYQISPSWRERN